MDDFLGALFEGVIEGFGELIGQVLLPLFQLWFSSVWSFITGSGVLAAIGYGIFLLMH